MQKVTQKTNLRKEYDKLNLQSKRLLISRFMEEFNLKTEARLYKVLNNHKKITGEEAFFFSKFLGIALAKVVQKEGEIIPLKTLIRNMEREEQNSLSGE